MSDDIAAINEYTSILLDTVTEFIEIGFHLYQKDGMFIAKRDSSYLGDPVSFSTIFEARAFYHGFSFFSKPNESQ